jgi:5,10-methylene-tetrahydrofolate dehydrogenase/methenyl tetrahydrofolate cyclohydrolase
MNCRVMAAKIIDGNAIAKQIRHELADQVRGLTDRGDVDFDPVARKASHITPVPGGLGR